MPDVTMSQLAARPTLNDLVESYVRVLRISAVGAATVPQVRAAQSRRDSDLTLLSDMPHAFDVSWDQHPPYCG